jgi:hypothetical protein
MNPEVDRRVSTSSMVGVAMSYSSGIEQAPIPLCSKRQLSLSSVLEITHKILEHVPELNSWCMHVQCVRLTCYTVHPFAGMLTLI